MSFIIGLVFPLTQFDCPYVHAQKYNFLSVKIIRIYIVSTKHTVSLKKARKAYRAKKRVIAK